MNLPPMGQRAKCDNCYAMYGHIVAKQLNMAGASEAGSTNQGLVNS